MLAPPTAASGCWQGVVMAMKLVAVAGGILHELLQVITLIVLIYNLRSAAGMDHYWIWAFVLFVLGIGLAVMEVFFPSAGILAFLSAAALIASIVMGFQQGPWTGIAVVAAIVGGLPTVLILGFRYWPKTRMGQLILLTPPASGDILPQDPEKEFLKGLIGRTGRAKTKMLLSGIVVVDGRPMDAVSEGMPIEVGQTVRIVQVKGNRVVVRVVEEEPASTPPDPLQRTYDDPFELPPA
jgi:membrane-bound ClpP family serine protease